MSSLKSKCTVVIFIYCCLFYGYLVVYRIVRDVFNDLANDFLSENHIKNKTKHKYYCTYINNNSISDYLIPSFPIDIVLTWSGNNSISNNELKYTLRSIYKYLPYFNHIYIVAPTNESYPSYINNNTSYITLIDQSILFTHLNPSYSVNNHNSLSFESVIHHIPNLSENYIYFNDDFLIGRYIPYTYWFDETGKYMRWNKRIINGYIRKHTFCETYNTLDKHTHFPQTMGKRATGYLEHHPRPMLKSYYFDLELKYTEWFQFIASHKQRYNSYNKLNYGASYLLNDATHSESIHLHIIADIILNNNSNIQIIDNIFSPNIVTHYWVWNYYNFEPTKLNQIVSEILCLKPATFCINDNFDKNRNSNLYKEQSRILNKFHEMYYKTIPEWEYIDNNQKDTNREEYIDITPTMHDWCVHRHQCLLY